MMSLYAALSLILAPALMIFMAAYGWNIAFSAFCSACLAALLDGLSLNYAILDVFSAAFAAFIGQWFPLFVSGAMFGCAMEKSGMARMIALLAFLRMGPRHVLLAILLVSLLLSYGGLGTFVIAFVMLPIGEILFRQASLSRSLLPAAILFCPTTLAMTMLPGSPSIQNLLPCRFLHTTIYAAPVPGLLSSLAVFLAGYAYLSHMAKKLPPAADQSPGMEREDDQRPKAGISLPLLLLPFLLVWLVAFLGIKSGLKGEYAISLALLCALVPCLLVNNVWRSGRELLDLSLGNAFMALVLLAAIMGFGAVLQKTSAYASLIAWMADSGSMRLAWDAVFINILAAVTGSSVASLEIFLQSGSERLLLGNVPPELLHRFLAIASSGLDSMPYATGVAVTLCLSKISLKKAYPHIFVLCAILPLLATLALLLYIEF